MSSELGRNEGNLTLRLQIKRVRVWQPSLAPVVNDLVD